jgi:hypothetical protein
MMIKGGIRIGGLGISGYDSDASAYFERAGVTDTTAKGQINAFIKGLKSLNLWTSSVVWPMRSAQNKGSGTTLYTFGGLGTTNQYNGTLVNGPTWNADGILFDGSNDRITLPNGAFGTSNTATTIISFLKNEVNTSRGIFLSQGNNNVGTDAFALGSPDSTTNTDGIGIAFTDQVIATKTLSWKSLLIGNTSLGFYGKNGGSVASFSLANSLNKSGNNCAIGSFGDPSGVAPFNGYAGLVIRINATPTTQLNSDIYNLYVSTMGSNRDLDADGYILRAGVTNSTAQTQINDFVVGVKALGLWDNMLCWPLRLTQNVGSGSNVYSLGGYGTYNGTIGGTISWGTDGMVYPNDSSFKYIATALYQSFNSSNSCFAVGALTSTSSTFRRYIGAAAIAGSELSTQMMAANSTSMYSINTWSESVGSDVVISGELSTFNWLGISFDYSTGSNNVNGQFNSTFGTTSRASSTPASRLFQIGGGQSVQDTFTGTMSFAAYFPTTIVSQANKLSLYSLYKTTLGTGLGLP